MDVDKLRHTLTNLTGSTKAAKLRQLMPEIEEKVEQGVRHEEIVAALKEGGLDVSLEAFRKTLYRYRKKHQAIAAGAPQAKPQPPKADGNPSARGVPTAVQEADVEEEAPSPSSSFEDALDPRKRDQTGEAYLTRRRPIIGKKRTKE